METKEERDDEGCLIEKTWPPPTITCGTDQWKAVKLLESLLAMHNYSVLNDGVFAESLKRKVIRFQEANGLPATGTVDPKTWRRLMELPLGY